MILISGQLKVAIGFQFNLELPSTQRLTNSLIHCIKSCFVTQSITNFMIQLILIKIGELSDFLYKELSIMFKQSITHMSYWFNRANLRRLSSSSLDFDSSSDEDNVKPNARLCRALSLTDRDPKNPWLQQCQQDSLHKLKERSDSSNVVGKLLL